MIGNEARFDAFLRAHRWASITVLRRDGSPANSIVAYACDGDSLVVSTPGRTFKRRALEHDPRVNLIAFSDREPFNFVAVEGRATIETNDLVAPTKLVFANIAEHGYSEPPDLPAWLTTQQRVIIRIRAERVSGVIR